jgi:hypothetical protein
LTCHRRGRRQCPDDAPTTYDRNDISRAAVRQERQRRNEGRKPRPQRRPQRAARSRSREQPPRLARRSRMPLRCNGLPEPVLVRSRADVERVGPLGSQDHRVHVVDVEDIPHISRQPDHLRGRSFTSVTPKMQPHISSRQRDHEPRGGGKRKGIVRRRGGRLLRVGESASALACTRGPIGTIATSPIRSPGARQRASKAIAPSRAGRRSSLGEVKSAGRRQISSDDVTRECVRQRSA